MGAGVEHTTGRGWKMSGALIVGAGQVGQGLRYALGDGVDIRDAQETSGLADRYDVLHICFPFSGAAPDGRRRFDDAVRGYVAQYRPRILIVHASVCPGYTTSIRDVAPVVAFSPVRGRHPNLGPHIVAFEKWVAAYNHEHCDEAARALHPLRTVTMSGDGATEKLELYKLLSNIRYGMEIGYMHEVERIGFALGLAGFIEMFNVWERSYNEGYESVGERDMRRPILYSGPIGGHCVMQNIDVLDGVFRSALFDWLRESNKIKGGTR
jgi:hypothetical protein